MYIAVLFLKDKSQKQYEQGMYKHAIVYQYNEILLGNKKEPMIDTRNNMDKYQTLLDNRKKPDSKGYI